MQQRIYRHHPERYRSENMATFVNTFNLFLFFVFSLCYMYQAVYAVIVLVKDHRRKITHVQDEPLHKFAVMIAGRNEDCLLYTSRYPPSSAWRKIRSRRLPRVSTSATPRA